jgi:hypothetical protein
MLGLRNWIWIALGVALALAIGAGAVIVETVDRTHENTIEVAKQAGASEAVAAGAETTLTQIGAAHEAERDIRSDVGFARYCECLRSATGPTARNCVRYLENKPLPDRQPADDQPCAGG